MHKTIKLKLFATQHKKDIIQNIITQYRVAVNHYIHQFFYYYGKLDKYTLSTLINSPLTERYKSNALIQAQQIYRSCINKKIQTHNKLPKFNGFPKLDAKFVKITPETNNHFDLWLTLSTLKKRHMIHLPTQKTKILNKWLELGNIIQGCELHENHIILWIKIEDQEPKQDGNVLGIDLGMRKLITTSDGKFLGTRFTELRQKIARKKPNSNNRKKAQRELNQYINETINQIPFKELKALGYENLKNITKGKKGFRQNPAFRKAQQHWCHRRIITKIKEKCQENCVCPVKINPKNTSITCPQCNHVAKENRQGEQFQCIRCKYSQDADLVGSLGVLGRTLQFLGSVESP